MERLRIPGHEISTHYPPIFYFPSVARMRHSRNAIIQETANWAKNEARGRIKIEYEMVEFMERLKASFHGREYNNPGFALAAISAVTHSPEEDEDLPINQIVVKDDTARAILELPRGPWLKRIETARRKFGMPALDIKSLREFPWVGNIAILHGYFQTRDDRSTLVFHEGIQLRERIMAPSREYQLAPQPA